MSQQHVLVIDSGIATITLNDPDAPVNTLSPEWVEEMTATFDQIEADDTIGGVIITSAKPGFMAGADLKYMLTRAATMALADAFDFSQSLNRIFRRIETCGKPVVAAINGFALGGGYELALACTHRILVDDPKAVVGLPEVNVGLLPGAGGTQRLPRLIGVEAATELLLSGRSNTPAQALELGLVDAVVPRSDLMAAAQQWLTTAPDPTRPWDVKKFRLPESDGLLTYPAASFFAAKTAELHARYGDNYPAPIAILNCVFEGVQLPIDRALVVESRHFARLLTDPVASNIIRTMFVNKGAAEKGVRRPADVPVSTVEKLGVLGAGMMGAGIAFTAAQAGISVALLDVSIEAAERGKVYSEKLVGVSVERGRMSAEEAQALLDNIVPTTDYASLAAADLVIETVYEDPAIKADVTAKAAAQLGEHSLFASNTSTLPISDLAEAFLRPEDFIGLHFFSPVDRMPLVEIIMGQKTGRNALARALDFVRQIRKTPIIVNDARGFYTSRVFLSYAHEGAELLREGVSPALIENAARTAGMAVGPLAVTDEVSLTLPINIARQAQAEQAGYARPASLDVLETMAETLGRSGRKNGAGYYDYPDGAKKRLWSGLSEHFPLAANQPPVEEVKQRLLYRQALETVRCMAEGVVTDPADADLGSILGWGFPAWTGGTISLIRSVGLEAFVADCERLAEKYGARFAPPHNLRGLIDSSDKPAGKV